MARMIIYGYGVWVNLWWRGGEERTDLCARVRDTDIATRVTFFRELAGEKVVQLGTEDTICNELALFANLSGHTEKLYKLWGWVSVSTTDKPRAYHPNTKSCIRPIAR